MTPAYQDLKDALDEIIGDDDSASTYEVTLSNGRTYCIMREDVFHMIKVKAAELDAIDNPDVDGKDPFNDIMGDG